LADENVPNLRWGLVNILPLVDEEDSIVVEEEGDNNMIAEFEVVHSNSFRLADDVPNLRYNVHLFAEVEDITVEAEEDRMPL
jgi:hypothetical protein